MSDFFGDDLSNREIEYKTIGVLQRFYDELSEHVCSMFAYKRGLSPDAWYASEIEIDVKEIRHFIVVFSYNTPEIDPKGFDFYQRTFSDILEHIDHEEWHEAYISLRHLQVVLYQRIRNLKKEEYKAMMANQTIAVMV